MDVGCFHDAQVGLVRRGQTGKWMHNNKCTGPGSAREKCAARNITVFKNDGPPRVEILLFLTGFAFETWQPTLPIIKHNIVPRVPSQGLAGRDDVNVKENHSRRKTQATRTDGGQ